MRKGAVGLGQEVLTTLGRDPRCGDAFVFIAKSCRQLKVLCYDRGGFWVCNRRLDQGKFSFPVVSDLDGRPGALTISPAEWELLLDGVLLRGRVVANGGKSIMHSILENTP
jgi:transposase